MSEKKPEKNSTRASDLGSILISGTTGFTVRKRTGVGLFVHLFLLSSMMIFGVTLLVYYNSFNGCLLAVAIGFCFAFVSHNLEQMKRIKQSLEFMNALFSSALGKGYKFCCVVKQTGEIVFYNRPFQAIFPAYMAQATRSFDTLVALYHVPPADVEKIKSMMASKTDGSVTTFIKADGSEGQQVTIHLETVDRPTGFTMLRGE